MSNIKSIDRGNGLVELRVDDKIIKLRRKRINLVKLIVNIIGCVLMTAWVFGLVFISTVFRHTDIHTIYYVTLSILTPLWYIVSYLLERSDK